MKNTVTKDISILNICEKDYMLYNTIANAITLTIMLVKFVNHCTHPIIPKLNDPAV